MNHTPKRVDLYFVLYLLALLLLLFDPREPQGGASPNIVPEPETAVEFFADPSEPRCIVADSAGHRLLRIHDSVITLWYSRPLRQLVPSLQLDSAGYLLWSSEHGLQGPFVVEHLPEERRLLLRWRFRWWTPELSVGEHEYRLRVRLDYSVGEVRHAERLVLPLHVSIVPLPTAETRAGQDTPLLPPPPAVPLPPLRLLVPDTLLEVPPFGQWSLELTVFGVGDARRELDSILLQPVGSVRVTPRDGSTLLVSGRAPHEGTQRVQVTLTRRSDRAVATATLTIVVRPLPRPDVPEELYPEREYRLDPRLRFAGQESRAEITDGHRLLASSPGTPLVFRPTLSDTGKVLLLRRFLNQQLLDEIRIPIRDFPAPELLALRLEGSSIKVRTRCFGTVENSPNECRCELLSPTGRVRELRGDLRRIPHERYGLVTEQSFLLEGVAASEPVTLLLHDRAGRLLRWSGQVQPR